jgi:transcriptional regulator with XRE-family HTH domain
LNNAVSAVTLVIRGMSCMVKLRLKELRNNMKLTQADVSIQLKIARETYSRYESGEREMTYETILSLASLFGVSVDYMLGRYDSEPVILSDSEKCLLDKIRMLDDRGKKSVLAVVEHEFSQRAEVLKKSAM